MLNPIIYHRDTEDTEKNLKDFTTKRTKITMGTYISNCVTVDAAKPTLKQSI